MLVYAQILMIMESKGFNMEDISRVIQGGYCIGCGVCPFVDSSLSISMTERGQYQASEHGVEPAKIASAVCPFAESRNNEDHLGEQLFASEDDIKHDECIGYYLNTYAGYVLTGGYREEGGSGGILNWTAAKLLETGEVDAVIHVGSSSKSDVMYEYRVSHTVDELRKGAKSKYYPVELSQVLSYVKDHDEKFAVIGLPCFIKALRLLENKDSVIRDRLKYHLGLVCGHLKSTFFALAEGAECGIAPSRVEQVDFRYKIPGHQSNDYGIKVTGSDENGNKIVVIKPTKEMSVTNWGLGYFKYNACEYCDDVLSETADVVCGDAWLPQYAHDGAGTNIVVVRDTRIGQLYAKYADEIHLESVTPDVVKQSQASGLRHRREGLAYRLYLKDQAGEWRPTKRVSASSRIPTYRKRVYRGRLQLIEASFHAFQKAKVMKDAKSCMSYFNENMASVLAQYRKAENPLSKKVQRNVKRLMKKILH